MKRDELTAKAAAKRTEAAKLTAEIEARTADPMADHFPLGPGGARSAAQRRGGARRAARSDASDARTWELMRRRDALVSEADHLERRARSEVFSDDLEGLHRACVQAQTFVDELVAKKADPEAVAKFGADVIQSTLSSARRKLKQATARLEKAEAYAPRPGLHGHSLRAAQATVALIDTQTDRPGPRTVNETTSRDWDAPDGAETRRALLAAERTGLVEQYADARTWTTTELGRELFADTPYDTLGGLAEAVVA